MGLGRRGLLYEEKLQGKVYICGMNGRISMQTMYEKTQRHREEVASGNRW